MEILESPSTVRKTRASEYAQALLDEIRKRNAEEKAVWVRERENMQRQVSRMREEVLTAENAKASLLRLGQAPVSNLEVYLEHVLCFQVEGMESWRKIKRTMNSNLNWVLKKRFAKADARSLQILVVCTRSSLVCWCRGSCR